MGRVGRVWGARSVGRRTRLGSAARGFAGVRPLTVGLVQVTPEGRGEGRNSSAP